jgi:hypothetical protein
MALAAVANQRDFLRKGIHLRAGRLIEHGIHWSQIRTREHIDRRLADDFVGDFQQSQR